MQIQMVNDRQKALAEKLASAEKKCRKAKKEAKAAAHELNKLKKTATHKQDKLRAEVAGIKACNRALKERVGELEAALNLAMSDDEGFIILQERKDYDHV